MCVKLCSVHFTTTDIFFFPCQIYRYMYTCICYSTDMTTTMYITIANCLSFESFFFFSFFFFFFFFFFNGYDYDLFLTRNPASILLLAITAGHTPVLKYWNMWTYDKRSKPEPDAKNKARLVGCIFYMSDLNIVAASIYYNLQCIGYKNQSCQL